MPTLIFISDTHTKHYEIDKQLREISENHPDAILVHSGDISYRGRIWEVEEFVEWYASLPFKNKIMIAGNHDFLFEKESEKASEILERLGQGIIYLNDSGIEVEGLNFWGSPVTPWFHDWAFNRVEEEINHHWELIPENTDILITHGPPFLTLDSTNVFGHIHEAAGIVEKDGVIYVNASTLDLYYDVKNSPIILSI